MPNNNPQQVTPQQQIAKAAEGANRAAERLENSAEQATSAAIEKVRQVREDAQSGIEHQREEIANRVRRVGGVLRSTGQTLSTDDPLSQQLFEAAGDRIERVAEYISNVTPGSLASDVQSLARRQPGLFFGGSFILGLALGRFAKSSAAGSRGGSNFEDESYEDTLAVRPSRAVRRKQQATQRAAAARTTTRSSGGLPDGVSGSSSSGSNVSGTTGAGSPHAAAANAAPSYGATSGVVARPASSGTPSSKAHDVGPGEGSKL